MDHWTRLMTRRAFAAVALCDTAAAHGGGLNAAGCHTNRKTGDYHCHRPPGAEAPRTPSRSSQTDANLTSFATPPATTLSRGKAYANCTAAHAAGAAPVYAGDPGYGDHLDRDRDGVGCE